MTDYTFHLDEWIQRFPLSSVIDQECHGEPCGVAYIEQLRAIAASRYELGPSVPTDIFVFGFGAT